MYRERANFHQKILELQLIKIGIGPLLEDYNDFSDEFWIDDIEGALDIERDKVNLYTIDYVKYIELYKTLINNGRITLQILVNLLEDKCKCAIQKIYDDRQINELKEVMREQSNKLGEQAIIIDDQTVEINELSYRPVGYLAARDNFNTNRKHTIRSNSF